MVLPGTEFGEYINNFHIGGLFHKDLTLWKSGRSYGRDSQRRDAGSNPFKRDFCFLKYFKYIKLCSSE